MDFLIKTANEMEMKLPGYIPYVLEKMCVDDSATFVYSLIKEENRKKFERSFKDVFTKISNGSIKISDEGFEEFKKLRNEFGIIMVPPPAIMVKLEAIASKINEENLFIVNNMKESSDESDEEME